MIPFTSRENLSIESRFMSSTLAYPNFKASTCVKLMHKLAHDHMWSLVGTYSNGYSMCDATLSHSGSYMR